MTDSFDPYHQWLGIRDPQRPPNLYRLLGVELFEADPDVIETAADRQMAHLRTYQIGPHAALSQQLLNEVSAAKVCLLDAAKKSDYDEQLRQRQPPHEPPVASGQLLDEDNLGIVVRKDSVALRPPGRGPRAERPWYVSTAVLLPVLGIVFSLVAYRVYRDYLRPSAPAANSTLANASSKMATANAGDPAPLPDADSSSDDGPGTGETGPSAPTPPTDLETDETASEEPSDEAGEAAAGTSNGDAIVNPPGTATEQADPEPEVGGAAERGEPSGSAAWNPAALAITGEPARFTTTQPMGPFLLALAQRDLTAADSALQALRVHRALGLPETLFNQAELVRETVTQFWQAVDASLETLAEADTLALGQVDMVVTKRDADSVTLEAPTGQQQVYELRRAKLNRDLAIGLVRRQYAASPAVAWRLIATFLAVDHQGDKAQAEHWAQQADLRGFATTFLTRIVRALGGESVASMDEPTNHSPPLPLTIPVAEAEMHAVADEPSEMLPDANQQKQARREILAPILAELRQQEIPADQLARQLLQRAESSELGPPARYVLLDSALSRARQRRDVDTALAAIDILSRDFEQPRADLRYELLQSLSRRLKGEERRQYAEVALSMARTAVAANEFDEGIRFASLAQSIGRSVPDRFFRRYLLDFRLEVDAIQKAYHALESGKTGQGELSTVDRAEQVRFQVLAQGDFETDMSDLRATDDLALRAVVEGELAKPATAEEQQSLAREWLRLSEQITSVEKTNALRRARYWYTTCLADLDRSQRVEVQQDLDAIDRVLGRASNQLDLTSIPPVGMSVGYGTFGINQNIDSASNPKVQPLPQVDGSRVNRFFWACAPSRIEYLVPRGANQFKAIGMVNAATQDGVQFVVKADGKVLFVSPVLKAMGEPLPIQVNLPNGTETLELIVDAQKSSVFDHTYWVEPQLLF